MQVLWEACIRKVEFHDVLAGGDGFRGHSITWGWWVAGEGESQEGSVGSAIGEGKEGG